MTNTYYNIIHSIEHVYRLFLDIIKKQLDQMGIYDINNIQAVMIYNIAQQEVSVGELVSRRIYYGSNVSYNLKKLTQTGYIIQTPSPHDKRSLYIKLSDKGLEVYRKIDQCLARQTDNLKAIFPNAKAIENVQKGIQALETFLNQNNTWL